MKSIINICIILLLSFQQSYAFTNFKIEMTFSDTSGLKNSTKKSEDNNDFEKLLKSIDCNDENYNKDVQILKKNIEIQLSSIIKRLYEIKKDTLRTKPLIIALTNELKTYDASIENEASILFWSYGVASMQGERIVSHNCYYLAGLKRKLFFIKAIIEKIEGSLLLVKS